MKKRFRHSVTYFVIRPIMGLYMRLKYNFKPLRFKPDKDIKKGPYLIVSNHVLNWDPFLVAPSFRVPIFYVASDMIFSIPFWSRIIKYLASPIPKTKYRSDMDTVRDMIKMVKSGGSIGIFAEGNATFSGDLMPIDKSIAKLAKLLKIPLVLYTIEGGYYSKPRWSKSKRKGKIIGQVQDVIKPDVLKTMNVDELHQRIIETIAVDDFAFAKTHQVTYKGKDYAEDIESAYFYCPSCHALATLVSHGSTVSCTACDFEATLDAYTHIHLKKGKYAYPTTQAWYHAQYTGLADYLASISPTTWVFKDDNEAVLSVERSKKKTPLGQAQLRMSKQKLEIRFDTSECIILHPHDLNASVQEKNKLIIYDKVSKKTYYLINHPKRSALKYVLAIEILQKGE